MDVLQSFSDHGIDSFASSASPAPGAGFAPGMADFEAACGVAETLARRGDRDRARALWRAMAYDPGCPTAFLPRVAAGLAGLGDDVSALEACRESARREPGRPEALFSLAFAMKRLGYPSDLAIPIADRALGLAPDFLPARALLAALLIEAGRGGDAEDLLRDAPSCSTASGGACRVGRMIALFRTSHRA